MKQISIIFLLLCSLHSRAQETLTDLNLLFNIEVSNSFSSPFTVSGTVFNTTLEYDGTNIQVGDYVAVLDGIEASYLQVASIVSATSSEVELTLDDPTGLLSAVPTGQAAIFRVYTPLLLPTIPDGLRGDLSASILDDLRLKIDLNYIDIAPVQNVTAGNLGIGVTPFPGGVYNITNNTTEGFGINIISPFVVEVDTNIIATRQDLLNVPKECTDTIKTTSITPTLVLGSGVVKNGAVWDNISGYSEQRLPEGVVVKLFGDSAIIAVCGSFRTTLPNNDYYADSASTSGFTNTTPLNYIRPLGHIQDSIFVVQGVGTMYDIGSVSGGSGGGVTEPATQIVVGTGTGVDSYSKLTYTPSSTTFFVNAKHAQTYVDTTGSSFSRPVANNWQFSTNPTTTNLTGIDYHGIDLSHSTNGVNVNNQASLYPFEIKTNFTGNGVFGRLVNTYWLAKNDGNGTLGNVWLNRQKVENNGTGTISFAWSTYHETPTWGINGIGDYRVFHINNLTGGSGTVRRGFSVGEVSGASSENYGFYSAADANFFDGMTIDDLKTAGSGDRIGLFNQAGTAVKGLFIGSGLSVDGDTLKSSGGGGGSSYYQTLKTNGTAATQRAAANFTSTSLIVPTLTDDSGNDETEVSFTIPNAAITETQLSAGVNGKLLPTGSTGKTVLYTGGAWTAVNGWDNYVASGYTNLRYYTGRVIVGAGTTANYVLNVEGAAANEVAEYSSNTITGMRVNFRNAAAGNAYFSFQTNASGTAKQVGVGINHAANSFTISPGSTAPGSSGAINIPTTGLSQVGINIQPTAALHFRGNYINTDNGAYLIGETSNNVRRITGLSDGRHGINLSSPTAQIHIGAGSAAANTAPLKFTSGTNLTTPEAGAIEYDGTDFTITNSTATRYLVGRCLKGSSVLDFPSTSDNGQSDLTVTVTGAAVGDAVSIGAPTAAMTNGTYFGWVSASNTVTVRFHNTTGTNDPASGTFNIIVTKY